LIVALAVGVHIHNHSHPADKVEYRIVEEEYHRGFAEMVRRKDFEEECHKDSEGVEYRRGSVEYHILNVGLLHRQVVPVFHKDFVEHYYQD
jgi:hypothetical protein